MNKIFKYNGTVCNSYNELFLDYEFAIFESSNKEDGTLTVNYIDMLEEDKIINKTSVYQASLVRLFNYLRDTDWVVIKQAELGINNHLDITEKRALYREKINMIQAYLKDL